MRKGKRGKSKKGEERGEEREISTHFPCTSISIITIEQRQTRERVWELE